MKRLLRRLRAFHRCWWHCLTGRWPRYPWPPMDGQLYLARWERKTFRTLADSYRARGHCAPEPRYERRPR